VKVLFIHSSADLYGSDRSLLRLLQKRTAADVEPTVCLPYRGALAGRIEVLGVRVEIFDMGVVRRRCLSLSGIPGLIFRTVSGVRRIRRLVRDGGIGLVHTNTSAVIAGAVAARLAGVPHVWHVREIYTLGRACGRLYASCLDLLSDRIICVSGAVRDNLLRYRRQCARKIVVIPNGIDAGAYAAPADRAAIRARYGIPADALCIGAVGRINRVKGFDLFLEVAAVVCRARPNAFFVIAGDVFSPEGDSREQWRVDALREQLRELGIASRVKLAGFVDDVCGIFRILDLYLFTSVLPDAFPTTVLEAQAAGVPVIAADIGGVRDIITDGVNGLLVSPGDRDGFAGAVDRIIGDPALRQKLSENGARVCREKFDAGRYVRDIEAIYKEAGGV